ncbi:glycosyltransferase [Prochlorococcus sp. MIT 1341]|uniref:glycosyltransferase n=1 Tax=Prochlorococcus sp. MIT 1341 TaxID=3096221 RepID=UPI002A756A1F|nr:glycosyltransferase [Prochlorococcus sp. MIT 1341]
MTAQDLTNLPSRIALVHEWFSDRSVGGAESVVEQIDLLLSSLERQPQLFSLIDDLSISRRSWLTGRKVKTTFIQRLPFGRSHVQQYLPLLPYAIEQLDLSDYSLVISSSHLVAKGVLTSPDQMHISYVHTPVRYAWDQMNLYLKRSALSRNGLEPIIRLLLHDLRKWDQLSATRVDYLLSNSRFTARRIAKFWGRESKVLHPPVEVERFFWDRDRSDHYLCLCRLVPYKRVDLVIRAFNQLQLPLNVVGDGPERRFLEKIAGPTIKILGKQDDSQVQSLMSTCRAFVYAGLEDFGIAPVEAMASGAPVIGFGRGGLLDTIRCATSTLDAPTGVLFPEQSVQSICDAVSWFEEECLWKRFSAESLRIWAENFRPEAFRSRLEKILLELWSEHQTACSFASAGPARKFDFPCKSESETNFTERG